jgi:hypothetical protein
MGLVTFYVCVSDGAERLPRFDLTEDGRLCSTGQHCPGFLKVIYDALIHLGYDGDAPVYRC